MATNITVVDSVNYPDNTKTVTVDLKKLVDAESEGDELWFLSVATNATGPGSTNIDDELASYMLNGYSKTSGLKLGPYSVASGTNHLRVSIDGSTYREVTVSPGLYAASDLAGDLQDSLQALAGTGQLEAGNLSFKNCLVDVVNGRVRIKSGTTSNSYTGAGKSSVVVLDGVTTTGFAAQVGFDAPFESEDLATLQNGIVVTSVSSTSSSGGATLNVTDGTQIAAGDALHITDGTTQEYVVVQTGGVSALTLKHNLSNTWNSGARVQTVVWADPDGVPSSPINTVDKLMTTKISSIVSQINFAS